MQALAINPKLLRVQNADQQCRSTRLGRSGTKVPRLGPTTNPTRRLIFLISHTSHLTSQRLILLPYLSTLGSVSPTRNSKQQTIQIALAFTVHRSSALKVFGGVRSSRLLSDQRHQLLSHQPRPCTSNFCIYHINSDLPHPLHRVEFRAGFSIL